MSLSLKLTTITLFFMALNIAAISMSPIANAATGGRYYQIELNETAKKDKKIIRGVMIRCTDTDCRGKKTGTSSASMCAKIARTFGPVKSFSAGETVFDEAAIEKCNKKA